MHTPRFALSLVGVLLSLTVACGDEALPIAQGELQVAWEVLPAGCEDGGVETILVSLEGGGELYAAMVDCVEGEGAISAPAGNYSMTLIGLDASGTSVVGAEPAAVLVRSDLTTTLEDPFVMTSRPGSVVARWRFEDGLVCGAHDVDTVEVIAFDANDFLVQQDRFSCNEGEGELTGLPQGEYFLLARAVATGEEEDGDPARFEGSGRASVKRGQRAGAQVVLSR